MSRGVVVALASALLVPAAVPAALASHAVIVVDDDGDGAANAADCDPGAPVAGACSLRDAIEYANNHAGDDVIEIETGLTSGSDTTVVLLDGRLEPTETVTVRPSSAGAAGEVTIDGADSTRIFQVTSQTTTLTVQDLVLTNGHAGEGSGGAIRLAAGSVELERVAITNSTADIDGGGIFVGDFTSLSMTNVTLSGNVADDFEGGASGGAIFAEQEATVRGAHVTIVDNDSALGSGGGIAFDPGGRGSVALAATVFAGNTADGAAENCSGTPPVLLDARDTNLADDGSCGLDVTEIAGLRSTMGGLADNGGNTRTHALKSGGTAVDAEPGPACTDVDGGALTDDQRGQPRPAGGGCDSGAYELQPMAGVKPPPPPPPNRAPVAVDDFVYADAGVPVTIHVLANDSDPDGDPIVISNVLSAPANGNVTATAGQLGYASDADFVGTVTFDYEIADPGGLTDSATVTVVVQAPGDTSEACPRDRVPAAPAVDIDGNPFELDIDCLYWWGIAVGIDDTHYGPGLVARRDRTASFSARLVTTTGGELTHETPSPFSDHCVGPHERNVAALAAAGIILGLGDGTFDCLGPVTRGQVARLLVLAYEQRTGLTLTASRDWFSDDDGTTHEDYVNRAREAGFTIGLTNTVYGHDLPLRRDQLAGLIVRVLDRLVELGYTLPPDER